MKNESVDKVVMLGFEGSGNADTFEKYLAEIANQLPTRKEDYAIVFSVDKDVFYEGEPVPLHMGFVYGSEYNDIQRDKLSEMEFLLLLFAEFSNGDVHVQTGNDGKDIVNLFSAGIKTPNPEELSKGYAMAKDVSVIEWLSNNEPKMSLSTNINGSEGGLRIDFKEDYIFR